MRFLFLAPPLSSVLFISCATERRLLLLLLFSPFPLSLRSLKRQKCAHMYPLARFLSLSRTLLDPCIPLLSLTLLGIFVECVMYFFVSKTAEASSPLADGEGEACARADPSQDRKRRTVIQSKRARLFCLLACSTLLLDPHR